MPPMQFPKIIAFVEGTMERLFLNNNFRYVRVVPVSNGSGWTTNALAEQISSFFAASGCYDHDVVVWVDRERRTDTAEAIHNAIFQALCEAGADPARLHLLVCDRMTENIILADEHLIRLETADPDYEYSFEGSGGKHLLKSHYQSVGETYKETFHGLRLLKKLRLKRCSNSPSVARFLQNWSLPCWWIDDFDHDAALG